MALSLLRTAVRNQRESIFKIKPSKGLNTRSKITLLIRLSSKFTLTTRLICDTKALRLIPKSNQSRLSLGFVGTLFQ